MTLREMVELALCVNVSSLPVDTGCLRVGLFLVSLLEKQGCCLHFCPLTLLCKPLLELNQMFHSGTVAPKGLNSLVKITGF